ncbi:TPA: nucleotidyltransferase domain-containing protein [Acinetobacter baumannii]|nr:nucleotidyltransferase domain-containing protein [Acinetobacter baumannii]MDC5547783.1 nucleotidyltransferase domain-containing protein [Acinetobacter baumannii]MDX7929029.1 nucleotidyltransferase domain-containing protein [Acinetobacter baumannii]
MYENKTNNFVINKGIPSYDYDGIFDILQEKLDDPISAIFLVGSRAEGLSTSKADIDLIVIMPDDSNLGEFKFLVGIINELRYEALLIREREFLDTLKSKPVIIGRRLWLHKYRKFICGVPIYGENYAKQLIQEGSIETLVSAATDYFQSESFGWFDKFSSFYYDLRKDEALYCIRMALSDAAEAVLVQSSDLHFKEQWRISRVNRTFSKFSGLEPLTEFISKTIAGFSVSTSIDDYLVQCSIASAWLNLIAICPDLRNQKINLNEEQLFKVAQELIPFCLSKRDNGMVLIRSTRRSFEVTEDIAKMVMQYILAIPSQTSIPTSISTFVDKNLRPL